MTIPSRHRLALRLLSLALVVGPATALASAVTGSPAAALTGYDAVVLADHPVAFWATTSGTLDVSGRRHDGKAVGGTGGIASLPDGETTRTYDGVGQYVTVPTSPDFSISTARALTWEAWIKPAVLQFPHSTGGYVDDLGKCASYSPTCEWEARMYNAVNSQNRASRLSAYVFNPSAGLGSAADWQPVPGLFTAGGWIHVVGEYQTRSTPSGCSTASPGTIAIWVDGVKQNFAAHAPTGCMSQYSIVPRAGSSPLTIGTMARDSWFQGAIGKVAVYDGLLSQAQIDAHVTAMTGRAPSGSCSSSCTLLVQPGPGTATATPAPTATPTATATSTAAATPTPAVTSSPAGVITASTRVTSSWSGGYCSAVTVSTSGPSLSSWVATTPLVGRVTSLWGASGSATASVLTLRNLSYNGVLTPGSPVTNVGFCVATS